ncbi:hypothetical protein FUSO4_04865 [Fusobacterium necrophorum DJ-1]|nr:hypothetical protein FUSO4_04865 [Fusobacterium necrophorum DJ-1]KDE70172.1 hypothetical protein FUSO6_05000 [Fusobacterium necrophorum DAB]
MKIFFRKVLYFVRGNSFLNSLEENLLLLFIEELCNIKNITRIYNEGGKK